MRYQSFIRFLDYCQADYSDGSNINVGRLKKLANAEFSMHPEGIIHIDNFSYSKSDVLKELERPDFIERIPYHLTVRNDKALLDFLEKGTLGSDKISWRHLKNDPSFIAFVSPYFAEPYSNVMKAYLQKLNWKNADDWLQYKDFILPDGEEEAYKSVRMFADDSLRMFRNLSDANYRSKKDELKLWAKDGCASFFNDLPDYLYFLSDAIARALIHVTVALQKAEKKLVYQISKQLIKFENLDPQLKEMINKNHKIYAKNSGYGTGMKFPRSVWGIFWIVILLVRIVGCIMESTNSGNDHYLYRPENNPSYAQAMASLQSIFSIDKFRKVRSNYFSADIKDTLLSTPALQRQSFMPYTFVYLLFQQELEGKPIFPLGIKNKTNHSITVYYIANNSLYKEVIDSSESAQFGLSGTAFDIVLDGENHSVNDVDNVDLSGMQGLQYIRLSNDAKNDIKPDYNDNRLVQLSNVGDGSSTVTVTETNGLLHFKVSDNLKITAVSGTAMK